MFISCIGGLRDQGTWKEGSDVKRREGGKLLLSEENGSVC